MASHYGESSASPAESSSGQSQLSVGVGGGPASPPGPSPHHQSSSPSGTSSINVPVPMEQLKSMAQEMNTILTRLMVSYACQCPVGENTLGVKSVMLKRAKSYKRI